MWNVHVKHEWLHGHASQIFDELPQKKKKNK
jgi:hypothetical protein